MTLKTLPKLTCPKVSSITHSNRKWLVIAGILFLIGLWIHGEHTTVAATVGSLGNRLIDALGDVFMDRGINQ